VNFFAILHCDAQVMSELRQNHWRLGPRSRPPAYEIFSIKRRFQQKFRPPRFNESSYGGVRFGYPFKTRYYNTLYTDSRGACSTDAVARLM